MKIFTQTSGLSASCLWQIGLYMLWNTLRPRHEEAAKVALWHCLAVHPKLTKCQAASVAGSKHPAAFLLPVHAGCEKCLGECLRTHLHRPEAITLERICLFSCEMQAGMTAMRCCEVGRS